MCGFLISVFCFHILPVVLGDSVLPTKLFRALLLHSHSVRLRKSSRSLFPSYGRAPNTDLSLRKSRSTTDQTTNTPISQHKMIRFSRNDINMWL